jgi:hypothetical protein
MWEVIVRRKNGRFVKAIPARSLYDAKVKAKRADNKYDHTYVIEIQERERRTEQ